jgi:hypothetical protein
MLYGLLLSVLLGPGVWLPYLVGFFKEMGDGTGNESHYIEPLLWTLVGSALTWPFIIWGIFWAWSHVSIVVR